jgi:hypothetical protein
LKSGPTLPKCWCRGGEGVEEGSQTPMVLIELIPGLLSGSWVGCVSSGHTSGQLHPADPHTRCTPEDMVQGGDLVICNPRAGSPHPGSHLLPALAPAGANKVTRPAGRG